MTAVRLHGLTLDVPPQVIAFAVAPVFSTMAATFGVPRPVRVLDACPRVAARLNTAKPRTARPKTPPPDHWTATDAMGRVWTFDQGHLL